MGKNLCLLQRLNVDQSNPVLFASDCAVTMSWGVIALEEGRLVSCPGPIKEEEAEFSAKPDGETTGFLRINCSFFGGSITILFLV